MNGELSAIYRPSPRKNELADFRNILTTAPKALELCEQIRRVAMYDASVLVRGETWIDKERGSGVARAIHNLSERQNGPFLVAKCATFTSEFLAS